MGDEEAGEVADLLAIVTQYPPPFGILAIRAHRSGEGVDRINECVMRGRSSGGHFQPLLYIQKVPFNTHFGIIDGGTDDLEAEVVVTVTHGFVDSDGGFVVHSVSGKGSLAVRIVQESFQSKK